MPVYEYECVRHGVFEEFHPMAESHLPRACPECGSAAPRVVLSAAVFAALPAAARKAHTINEASRYAPKSSRQGHGAGCGCCSSGKKASGRAATGKNGERSFPSARPWMISH